MARYPYTTKREKQLENLMRAAGVLEEDLEEKFVHASKPGGQNVNKVATCVELRHAPSGIVLSCQEARTQGRNRYLARERLLAEILERRQTELRVKQAAREKRKRQNRKRPQGLKESILESKRKRSTLKGIRQKIPSHQWKDKHD